MPAEPHHRHNGGPLSDDMRRKFWDHVRAREVLNEQMDEVRLDIGARKELAKADGFDVNILEAVIKRRKAGEGETMAGDQMIRVYEDALREQGALPLEQTRKPTPPPRRPVEDIAHDLHGEDMPEMPERPDKGVMAAAEKLNDLARESGGTMTLSGPGGSVTFGGDRPLFD